MKIKVTRKDGSPIIGRKKSLAFTITDNLDKLGKASEKDFCISEISDEEWSVVYQSSEMEESNDMLEFVFQIEDYQKTLEPVNIIYWKDDIIEDTKFFTVERL